MVLALGLSVYFRRENARRDRVEGGRPGEGALLEVVKMHDLAPGASQQELCERLANARATAGFRYTP